MGLKLILNIYDEYVKNGYSIARTAKALNIDKDTVHRHLREYKKRAAQPMLEQLAPVNKLTIEKHAENIAKGNDKAIERQFKYVIAPIVQHELASKAQTAPVHSDPLKNLVEKLKHGLTPYQRQFHEAPQRFKGVLSSTKAGKTYYCIFELLRNASEIKAGQNIWWVAPTYKVADIAFRRICNLLRENSIPFEANLSSKEIRLSGVCLQFRTAEKPDNLYGEDVQFAVFDEFTRSSTQAWEAVYSTLTKTDGRAILIGNYTSSANWGVKMVVERGTLDPANWAFFKVTIWQAVEAGIVKREVAEQAQKDLHPNVFKALYLAEGSFDETQLIKDPDKIPEMFARQLSEKNPEMYISADIAFEGADLFVVCVWRGLTIVEIFTMAKSNSREVIDALQKLSSQYNVPERNLIYDASGLGNFIIGYLPKAQPFVGNVMVGRLYANLRSRCYYELSTAISRGQIAIEPKTYSKEIEEELLAMRTRNINGKLGISPKEDIKKILGRSTDFADTLMMRFFYELTKIKHD